MATAREHLDLNRQGQRSTQQPTISTTSSAQQIDVNDGDEDNDDDDDNIISRQDDEPVIKVVEISHTNHSHLTGRFPHTSIKGNSYILVSVYNGYVYMEQWAKQCLIIHGIIAGCDAVGWPILIC